MLKEGFGDTATDFSPHLVIAGIENKSGCCEEDSSSRHSPGLGTARIRLAIALTAASDFCRSSPRFQGTNTGCEQ